ncbi:MAG: transporter [Porphyromonadaceae bacterium CG2_30_38_12]|nr:MAG: transporter [Porphyromonadaceae bacterium CG2_30_38_12]
MSKISLKIIFFFIPFYLSSENVTLELCLQKAQEHYPLTQQYGLIDKTKGYNIANANKAWLPQLNLTGKITYQSEAIKIAIPVINLNMEQSKEQYNLALDVSQTIWDGGVVKSQKHLLHAQAKAEKQQVEVELYALKERINQLYFGILLLNEQLTQLGFVRSDLQASYERIVALKQNGVAGQADVDAIRVEQLNLSQKETDMQATRSSYVEMLATFTGLNLDSKSEFSKPITEIETTEMENKRPELLLLSTQSDALNSQRNLIVSSNLPKIGLFVQGGYGKPGLNMLSDAISPYYIGGLRLSWNISGLYTQKNNLDKLSISQKSVEVQKETFLFNNKLQNQQQTNEIKKLKATLKTDNEIIELRNNISKATTSKLENGTATVNDLLRDINATSIALQNRALHEIQVYMAIYQLKNNTNN